jgi:hypothetical protein
MMVPAAMPMFTPPVKAGLDGFVTGSCSQGSEQAVLGSNRATGLSTGVCTSDTTMENGLTKSQKWLIEWLREGVKDDEPHDLAGHGKGLLSGK